MQAKFRSTAFLCLAGYVWSCALLAHADAHKSRATPLGVMIQRGAQLALWGVTDDNYAIYQDGPNLYATALLPGATRRFIANIGDKLAFVQTSGKVAFIWTDRPLTKLAGVSPLLIWTAASGAKLASSASMVATFGTAASPDSQQVLFITGADRDGTVGDLVLASPDLTRQRTLVSRVAVDYTNNACAPLLGFAGCAERSFAVAAYCRAGAQTATLTAAVRGTPTDLLENVAVPPRWSADASGEHFITSFADTRSVVSVDTRGSSRVLDDTPSYGAFLDGDGAVIEVVAQDPSQPGELRRIELGARPSVRTLAPITGSYYTSLHNGSGYYTDLPTAKDGKHLLYYNNVDPQLGLTDLWLIDLSSAPASPVTLAADLTATTFGELFTADSRYALYYKVDAATGNPALHAASSATDDREISDGYSAWNNYAATGSTISYLDHTNFDPNDTSPNAFPGSGAVLADLHSVDVAAHRLAPVLIARQAYAGYYPAYARKTVVFSWDRASDAAGIYLAWLP
jgi:hypothetical protein